MWMSIIKDLFTLGTELYATLSEAKEEEQQHAYEFMVGKIGDMRDYFGSLKDRILKRNADFLAKAKQQAAELARDDEPTNPGKE